MFWNKKNMRFYNVLLTDDFSINVDHFKLIYSVLQTIYVFYIDKNYFLITFKHFFGKINENSLILMNFWHIFGNFKNFTIFCFKTCGFTRYFEIFDFIKKLWYFSCFMLCNVLIIIFWKLLDIFDYFMHLFLLFEHFYVNLTIIYVACQIFEK